MKPIEPGCLAIIMYGRGAGSSVSVVKFVGAGGPDGCFRNCWEIIPIPDYPHITIANGDALLRIDDPDLAKQEPRLAEVEK